MTPLSTPSASTSGTISRPLRAIIRPTSRTDASSFAVTTSSCMTSTTRRNTWGRNSGSGAPARSSTQRVWALRSPSRTGTYSVSLSSRRHSSAYPIAAAIESVSGLRWPVT